MPRPKRHYSPQEIAELRRRYDDFDLLTTRELAVLSGMNPVPPLLVESGGLHQRGLPANWRRTARNRDERMLAQLRTRSSQ
jgi:hypothetical protein